MADATILIVEDEEKMRRLFDLVLRPEGYHLLQADSGEAAPKLLEEGGIDLVLTDLQMAKVSGLEVLEHVTRDYPDLPVVIITGYGTVKSAVEAMKKGAFDYISKPVDNDELKIVIRRALEMRRLTQEHRGLSQELRERFDFDNIVSRSAELTKVKELAKDLAATDSTVLISGESGTGKELLARAIHYASQRAGGPMVAINCAAIPELLLESELFGYEKGAFTDARRAKPGRLLLAHRGTLFLDEIGEMSPAIQAKLLRVLEDHTIEPLGGVKGVKVDLRLLVATNQEPEIDLDAFDAPQRLDHVVFQHAQELGLNRVAHLVDFVKKERAAMRQEQAARLGFPGVRERSLLVTEQLGLQQQFGERRAVDRDHGSPGPRAGIVDRPGQELLAGPALAADQHRRVGHGEVLGECLHLGELDGPADDVVEIEPGAQFLAQPPVLLGQPAHLQRAPDHDL